MATEALVKQLNKEVKTLRRDVAVIKNTLFRVLAIPEENLKLYKNSASIKRALGKALKIFPR